MSTSTSIPKIGLGNSIDFSQTAAKNRFLGAVSENLALEVQKPVFIAKADVCSAENIHLSFVKAKRLHQQLKALKEQRAVVYEKADTVVKDSPLYEELLEEARVIYRQIRDLLRTEDASKLMHNINVILHSCQNLSPDERAGLEDLKNKLEGWIYFIKPSNKVNSKPKLSPKKTPTPTQQRAPIPQLEFPEWLRYIIPIITGSEQRA